MDAIRRHVDAGRYAAAAEVLLAACSVGSVVPREAGYPRSGGVRGAEYVAALVTGSFEDGCAALVGAGAIDAAVNALSACVRMDTDAATRVAAASCRLLEVIAGVRFGPHHPALLDRKIAPLLVSCLRSCVPLADGSMKPGSIQAVRFALGAALSWARPFTDQRPVPTNGSQAALTPAIVALAQSGALPAAVEVTEAIARCSSAHDGTLYMAVDRSSTRITLRVRASC